MFVLFFFLFCFKWFAAFRNSKCYFICLTQSEKVIPQQIDIPCKKMCFRVKKTSQKWMKARIFFFQVQRSLNFGTNYGWSSSASLPINLKDKQTNFDLIKLFDFHLLLTIFNSIGNLKRKKCIKRKKLNK